VATILIIFLTKFSAV